MQCSKRKRKPRAALSVLQEPKLPIFLEPGDPDDGANEPQAASAQSKTLNMDLLSIGDLRS